MLLIPSLGIEEGEVIALVGAGGKTSLALRLLTELKAQGRKALFTTTTRILEPVPGPDEVLLLEEDEGSFVEAVEEALRRSHAVIAAAKRLDEKAAPEPFYPFPMRPHKLAGIPPDWIDRLHHTVPEAIIVVEADGARGRLLKAPAPHEPVVPSSTTLFIPIAHTDVLGKPLTGEYVHRPEEVSRLVGCPLGTPLDEAAVATLLLHPEGGVKGCPPSARVVPVLNRREEAAPQPAYRLARLLLGAQACGSGEESSQQLPPQPIERVVIAHLWGEEPVGDVMRRVAGVVLAGGGSRRFGSPKQLLPWGDRTVLEQVVDLALASPLAYVVVVLGCEAHRMRSLLAGRPIRLVVNENWQEGIASSIRAGLAALEPDTEAVVFLLADQPGISPETVAALLRCYHQTRKPVVAPLFQGKRGNPVLFDRSTFLELASLRGDIGGRAVIARHPQWVSTIEVNDPYVLMDIDTPRDWERARP